MSTLFLKVKIKSLAAEARIIRHEELKFPSGVRSEGPYSELHHHRVEIVRKEARVALLAYAYLRGRLYKQLERKCHEAPPLDRVAKQIRKSGEEEAHRNIGVEHLIAWVKQEAAATRKAA